MCKIYFSSYGKWGFAKLFKCSVLVHGKAPSIILAALFWILVRIELLDLAAPAYMNEP